MQSLDERPGARTALVVTTLQERIARRALPPGSKLPSIRKIAAEIGVSPSTAVEAYDRLVAEGAIEARRGSGFYVAAPAAASPFRITAAEPRLDRAVDPLWVSRQSLDADSRYLKPGCGWLPDSWLPLDVVQRALRHAARSDPALLADYGPPLGYAPLRQVLAQRLAEQDIAAEPGQILLTDSGSQAIDLICRLLLNHGDTVVVDDPCYFNFIALLRANRLNVVAVPYEPDGPDIVAFQRILKESKPRLYITNSAVHNPTGATLSTGKAHQLLKIAEQHRLAIVEDDIFADFADRTGPRLAALDGLQQVIAIGSFSKTISASIRCGYIAARRDWIENLTDIKVATCFGGSSFTAAVIDRVLRDGGYRKHVQGLRTRLAQAMGKTAARLRALHIEPWADTRAGMFLWAMLPGGIDSTAVAKAALAQGVILAPGNVFSVSQTAASFMRFNAAQSLSPKVFDVLEAALRGASS